METVCATRFTAETHVRSATVCTESVKETSVTANLDTQVSTNEPTSLIYRVPCLI